MQLLSINRGLVWEELERLVGAGFEDSYVRMVESIIEQKPFGNYCFYIHQFLKNCESGGTLKKLYHHPRMTKPDPVPGGKCLRVNPKKPDQYEIKWALPNEGQMNMCQSGKVFADETVWNSVKMYEKYLDDVIAGREPEMTKREPGDVPIKLQGEYLLAYVERQKRGKSQNGAKEILPNEG